MSTTDTVASSKANGAAKPASKRTAKAAPVRKAAVAKKPAAAKSVTAKKPTAAKKTTAVKRTVAVKKPAVVKTPVAAKKPVSAKPVAKKAVVKAAKPMKPAIVKMTPKAVPKEIIVPKEKIKKAKLVRDSFSMPEAEYAVLGAVKKACLKAGVEVKKSELLRIGVALIQKMDVSALKGVLATLPPLKAGRPKQEK
jgi:hypothetical protein